MATQADIRQRIFDYLYSSQLTEHPAVSLINGAIDNATTSITVDDAPDYGLVSGTIIEFFDGEQCFVTGAAGNVLTVIRGWNGTTKAAHSDNDPFSVDPRFTISQVDDAIDATLLSFESWGVHNFAQGGVLVDPASTVRYFEIDETDIDYTYGILSLYYFNDQTNVPVPLPFRLQVGIDTESGFATTTGIHVPWLGNTVTGAVVDNLWFTYAQVIDSVTDLLPRQEELVVIGSCSHLLGKAITPRTQDPGRYTDRTVQAGQMVRDGRWFQAEFFVRVRAEAAQLAVERQKVPGTVQLNRAKRWRA